MRRHKILTSLFIAMILFPWLGLKKPTWYQRLWNVLRLVTGG